jgi:hypothetical protein
MKTLWENKSSSNCTLHGSPPSLIVCSINGSGSRTSRSATFRQHCFKRVLVCGGGGGREACTSAGKGTSLSLSFSLSLVLHTSIEQCSVVQLFGSNVSRSRLRLFCILYSFLSFFCVAAFILSSRRKPNISRTYSLCSRRHCGPSLPPYPVAAAAATAAFITLARCNIIGKHIDSSYFIFARIFPLSLPPDRQS